MRITGKVIKREFGQDRNGKPVERITVLDCNEDLTKITDQFFIFIAGDCKAQKDDFVSFEGRALSKGKTFVVADGPIEVIKEG